jgi:hypothetical protein
MTGTCTVTTACSNGTVTMGGIGDCNWYYTANYDAGTTDTTSGYIWVRQEIDWQNQIITMGGTSTITYRYANDINWHNQIMGNWQILDEVEQAQLPEPIVLTPEQIAAQEARRLQLEAEAEIKMQKRVIAEAKGEQLVADIIGEEAFKQYKSRGYIDIPSLKEAGKSYRIRAEKRIGIVKDGKELALSLCIHPQEWGFVRGDLLSTHILLCKFDEEFLNKKANLHRLAA